MSSISQGDARRLSVLVIALLWLWQASVIFFPHERGFNWLTMNVGMTENFPLAALITTIKGALMVAGALWLLRLTGEGFRDLGFTRDGLSKQLLTGAGFGLGIFVLNSAVLLPLLEKLTGQHSESNRVMFSSITNLAILFVLSIVKGGFMEEFERIFVITRFEKLFGFAGLVLALAVSTILFGFGHAYQGTSAIVGTAVIGFLNALVYLRKRRALEAVAAHAVFDLLGCLFGAILYYGK
jgi:membrane protease YdiL (CAAX protease family)